MKLFTISMMAIMAISIVLVQVPSTTESRPTDNQNHFKVTSLNNFVSTVPVAHSVDGHKEGIIVQAKILKDIEAFRPTTPGDSPGIGHPHPPRLSDDFK
ncbi:precursor of CEP9-like [Raphanus sativus]|uniref:Precursor of CEP9-like n=1 Tax=Raphanus sativus TaxID=3726 RepID=A0A9W3DKB5_RAPSA|nr:precursor of CEP9-like [Raphanus sativus]